MLTYEEQEAGRREKLAEAGTMPPCPFCQRPRVARSDYIRCLPCGINWLADESELPNYLNRNPAAARSNPMGTPRTFEEGEKHGGRV